MEQESISNQGRQSVRKSWRQKWERVLRVLVNPMTWTLLLWFLRAVVAIAKVFDKLRP